MKQSHWLLRIAKNFDWSRKITQLSVKLDSNGFSWNENLQKSTNLEKSRLLLSSEQPCACPALAPGGSKLLAAVP